MFLQHKFLVFSGILGLLIWCPKAGKTRFFLLPEIRKNPIRPNACRNNKRLVSRSMGSLVFTCISRQINGVTLCSHKFTIFFFRIPYGYLLMSGTCNTLYMYHDFSMIYNAFFALVYSHDFQSFLMMCNAISYCK